MIESACSSGNSLQRVGWIPTVEYKRLSRWANSKAVFVSSKLPAIL